MREEVGAGTGRYLHIGNSAKKPCCGHRDIYADKAVRKRERPLAAICI